MNVTRTVGWERRLRDVVASYDGRPWRWGESDCACFMADCVRAICGADPLARYRGTYASRLQCVARLRWWRHQSVASAAGEALAALGCEVIDPRFARVGDVGVTADDVLAVRLPAGFVARQQDGTLRIVNVETAWAVAWPL